MNLPYLNAIEIDKEKAVPVYVQLAHGLATLIKQGVLKPGQKLPGSRVLAATLHVNRNTVVLATDELQAEGWVETRDRKGLFVNQSLPLVQGTGNGVGAESFSTATGFLLEQNPVLEAPEVLRLSMEFNDGVPDPRLSPLHELGREYHRLLKKANPLHLFSYSDAQGDMYLRKVLSQQLNEHRGLQTTPDTLFITRGSIMGIHLLAQVILRNGDKVAVGELNYRTANLSFEQCGAQLLHVPVDEKGMDTVALGELLKVHQVRMLYITSHHHHPTTVTLAPERRLHLYELAKQYRFCVLEDDYDFDYHYENKPTLPIASMDTQGLVVYIGSYSKVIYPGIRVGFVVAPQNLVQEMIKYRRIMDRQGDHLVERAIANLMRDGTMQRYLRKSKKLYKKRKEYFCQLLRQEFSDYLDFQEPEGGMAVWVKFKDTFPLAKIAAECRAKGLYLSNGNGYNAPNRNTNSCRMGFASMTEEEILRACKVLKSVLQGM
ncbi:GntR family transcriptional regulator/MocR family aminotransferase [Pontibacter ummariensis]|uniref:GntR family transcriptional regulator / MocR family aminotransferase n=1 Tax=Pontibacter ummariensis TaxID=1610492 RepID=A0A239LKS7_9BACT|nr:PLP-dependent aminotransferase family protein [Pontibacter ummariensis]PRY03126.1 GntR family transcriptional regulator/MocR family aminotransferase [Pontibacter ummariensis]SNT30184.1 GntR family transcriptional regulator / MocR family aminotransferase [Pontibacter ummariensis]